MLNPKLSNQKSIKSYFQQIFIIFWAINFLTKIESVIADSWKNIDHL